MSYEQPTAPAADDNAPIVRSSAEYLETHLAILAEQLDAKSRGIPLGPNLPGFSCLSETIGGCMVRGYLHWVIAPPGLGKTSWAHQVASTCGMPALYVSYEMDMQELTCRKIARTEHIVIQNYVPPCLSIDEYREHATASADETALLYTIDAVSSPHHIGPREIAAAAQEYRDKDTGHIIVVVDSLQAAARSSPSEQNENEVISSLVKEYQLLAAREKITILLVSERNRASMDNAGMHSGAGSRAIEYSGASVVSLDYAKVAEENGKYKSDKTQYADENGEKYYKIDLYLTKNRRGRQYVHFDYLYYPHFLEFREVGYADRADGA
jgi:replicative DNA helicase